MTPTLNAKPTGARAATLVELLSHQAARYGGATAYRFLDDTAVRPTRTQPTPTQPTPTQPAATMSFAEVHARALAIGAELSQRVSPGDRALLVYPPGLEFITAFFGCLYAGVVATPATYPKPRRPLPRMSRIAEDSGAKVALTTSQTLEAIDFERQDAVARSLEWIATDTAPSQANIDWRPHAARADDLAFLQYTSGSTSDPKGVMVTHGNLLANLEAIRRSFGLPVEPTEGDANVGVFWLPAYHDMGLIGGVLTPLYVGGPSVLMAPPSFLQRPMRWLEALGRYRATISGAPDFAYRLCVDKTTEADRSGLDLSQWRLAFCGAEPVRAETLTDFAEAFEPAGFRPSAFYPCYGLAEATLLAAGPQADEPPTILSVDRAQLGQGKAAWAEDQAAAQRLVGCGVAPAGHGVAIVQTAAGATTLEQQPDRTVGEIVVAGPSVAQGYWRREAESSAFGAAVAGRPGRWLRTGDLGFLYGGELFVTGRLKDVVIIRGRNYYPQDLEQTAESAHDAAMAGAAFACDIDGRERLVLVCPIDRSCREADRSGVVAAIRRAVLAEHEVDPHAVVLIRQGSLPITSSGKVQRGLCREQFLADELKALHAWRSGAGGEGKPAAAPPDLAGLSRADAAERIEAWMLRWMVDRVELDAAAADPQRPFAEQGVDSLSAVELSGELEQAFDVELPPIVAWNYPTPAALSRYLAEESPLVAAGEPSAAGEPDLESLLADIENLSDEEAARLLSEE